MLPSSASMPAAARPETRSPVPSRSSLTAVNSSLLFPAAVNLTILFRNASCLSVRTALYSFSFFARNPCYDPYFERMFRGSYVQCVLKSISLGMRPSFIFKAL